MRTTLLFIFLVGFSLSILAQQTSYNGAILDFDDSKRITGAVIKNLRTNESVHSNTMGLFSIHAIAGDTVQISKSDYITSKTVVKANEDLIVRMHSSFQLKEVNVYGQSKKDQLEDVMEDFRKKGDYYNGKKPPPLAYVLSPVSALYSLFGKTPKNARKFQSYMNAEIEESLIDRKFTIQLVQSITNLNDKDLKNFMSLYRPSYREVENWNDYDAQVYIKSAFERFEESGRPPAPTLPRIPIPKQEK